MTLQNHNLKQSNEMTTNNFWHDWIKFALRCLESDEFIRANQTVQHPPLKLPSLHCSHFKIFLQLTLFLPDWLYIDFTRIYEVVSFYFGRLELPLKSVAKLRCRKIWKLALRDAVAGGNHLDGAIRTGKRGRWRALPESVMSKNIGTLEVVCTQWPQEPSNSNRGTDKWKWGRKKY